MQKKVALKNKTRVLGIISVDEADTVVHYGGSYFGPGPWREGSISFRGEIVPIWKITECVLHTNKLDVDFDALKAAPMPPPPNAPDPKVVMECWMLLNELREAEGDSVTLFCDNPDFNGQPNNAIEIIADYTDFTTRRYTGETILECLKAAHVDMKSKRA